MINVIYMASGSHTGSTLLTLLLGAHPRVCAPGELFKLSNRRLMETSRRGQVPQLDRRCMCGAPTIRECPFWSRVDEHLSGRGTSLDELDVEAANEERFARDNLALFGAIHEVSGCEYIVDGHETERMQRLRTLEPEITVIPFGLERVPQGVVYSRMRKGQSLAKAAVRHCTTSVLRRRVLNQLGAPILDYETLVADPPAALKALMPRLSLDYDPVQLERPEVGQHLVGGNRMRARPVEIRPDVRWTRELSRAEVSLIEALSFPLRLQRVRERLLAQ